MPGRTSKERARNRTMFKARLCAHQKVKQALIRQVHEAGIQRGPNWPSGAMDAAFLVSDESSRLIQVRGGFHRIIASISLSDLEWETKELVASWLRKELEVLRKLSAIPGGSPVRRRKALSKLQIAEIAIELLECIGGLQLTSLFQELLDIDRHRKSLVANFDSMNTAAKLEASSQLQGKPLGVNKLAQAISVAGSSVTRWRRSIAYLERVALHKATLEKYLRDEYFAQIKALDPTVSDDECFRRATQMYIDQLPQRNAANAALAVKRLRNRKRRP